MAAPFNPTSVDLTTVNPVEVICYYGLGDNEYDGRLGVRISALFVIMIVSTAVTFLPVIAVRVPKLKVPIYVYLFARYFGAGVILATAFIQ
jgi:zinc transporter 1/2/3